VSSHALFEKSPLKPLSWLYLENRLFELPSKIVMPYWPSAPTTKYFLFLRKSTVTAFFINTMVDTPLCFRKSKSIFYKTFEIPTLRFINFLMRHGQKELALKAVTIALSTFLTKWASLGSTIKFFESWYLLVTLSSAVKVRDQKITTKTVLYTHQTLPKKTYIFNYRYHYNNIFALKLYLFRILKKIKPLFSFFIQKNDKLRRKHGRGKVDKMKVMWKYVPRYKRFYQAMHWLLKDLNFQKYKRLEIRLFHVFETFLLTPDLSFLTKIKNFVHSFVFRKHRRTLLDTLKTSI